MLVLKFIIDRKIENLILNIINYFTGNVTATTLHNMREFQQTTVSNVSNATEKAMHKIGDLQVSCIITQVPR